MLTVTASCLFWGPSSVPISKVLCICGKYAVVLVELGSLVSDYISVLNSYHAAAAAAGNYHLSPTSPVGPARGWPAPGDPLYGHGATADLTSYVQATSPTSPYMKVVFSFCPEVGHVPVA